MVQRRLFWRFGTSPLGKITATRCETRGDYTTARFCISFPLHSRTDGMGTFSGQPSPSEMERPPPVPIVLSNRKRCVTARHRAPIPSSSAPRTAAPHCSRTSPSHPVESPRKGGSIRLRVPRDESRRPSESPQNTSDVPLPPLFACDHCCSSDRELRHFCDRFNRFPNVALAWHQLPQLDLRSESLFPRATKLDDHVIQMCTKTSTPRGGRNVTQFVPIPLIRTCLTKRKLTQGVPQGPILE